MMHTTHLLVIFYAFAMLSLSPHSLEQENKNEVTYLSVECCYVVLGIGMLNVRLTVFFLSFLVI